MRETEYTFAVARVRANEVSLLDSAYIEQLIVSPDYKTALKMLADKGYKIDEDTGDYALALEDASERAWEFMVEISPDISELDMLIVKNDFQNLKAALKAVISGHDAKTLYVKPSCMPSEKLHEAVEKRDFNALPEYMREAAASAYDVLTRTMNGQKADIILDKAALETTVEMSKKTSSDLLREYAQLICATADIKMAYRAVRTGKEEPFYDMALAKCDTLDIEKLKESALEGEDSLFAYLAATDYAEAALLLKTSTTDFEKWCDDRAVQIMKKAKWSAFGVSPIAAYFLARDTEVKTLRIVLSAKKNELPAEEIRKRVRELYV